MNKFASLPLSITIPASPVALPVRPLPNSNSWSFATVFVVETVVVSPLTVKSPVTVKSFPIVTSSGKLTVTVPELSATVTSFAVPEKVIVEPNALAVEFEPSDTVILEFASLALAIEPANLSFAIEPASWAFVIVPDNDDVGSVSYTHLTLPTNREV